MAATEEAHRRQHPNDTDTPISEWLVAAVGLIMVISTVGYMLYHGMVGDSSPPDVVVRVEAIVAVHSGHLVTIRLTNHGGATAQGVVVEGALWNGTEHVETSHTEIDYAAAHSEAQAGLFFTHDPRQFELRVRALGYEIP